MATCSKCTSQQTNGGHIWCNLCRAAYMREYRQTVKGLALRRGREHFRIQALLLFRGMEGYITVEQVARLISQIE